MGLMPNRVAAVQLALANGSKRVVRVSENVFASQARYPMIVQSYRP
jgi:AICAR transformylase/IMP cyclohydrolase PurH